MENKIKKIIEESILVKEKLLENSLKNISQIAELCIRTLKNGGKIILCGNGGSAADSQHLAAELVVRFKKDRKSLPAIALTTNTSIITAIGNDYGYDRIFERQLESTANKNDILIAISTSGKAKNVVEAVKKAKEIGIKTIALTGQNGKEFAKSCDVPLIVPSSDTARIQEAHICIGHILCELIEDNLC
ncbi:MAG: D-sedoheptulose 7-phosphate isomerase [Candidatus Omnitrophica bacterium]|nr:D-sedoheptulose 7-phosphate isomerase [Candidatus Omnitrophota bacterium]MDD5352296.1 D-sedoheptulose 7-phosphate isomerase [Candidatus Omnitrophota bacterium]MDD5549894.1 D-sedoheptulose 7-phosphate isomerase [Candidatus Omnitrophota bacterium]